MATRLPVGPFRDQTFVAAEDLSDCQYHFIKLGTTGLAEVGADAEKCVGIIQNAPESGEQAVVRTAGESYLMTDGTTDIAVNDFIDSDASGHGVQMAADQGVYSAIAREAYTSATPGLTVVDISFGTLSAGS